MNGVSSEGAAVVREALPVEALEVTEDRAHTLAFYAAAQLSHLHITSLSEAAGLDAVGVAARSRAASESGGADVYEAAARTVAAARIATHGRILRITAYGPNAAGIMATFKQTSAERYDQYAHGHLGLRILALGAYYTGWLKNELVGEPW